MTDVDADQVSDTVGASQPGGVVGASQVGGTVGARLAQPQANLWTPAQLGSDLALWLDVWDSPFDLRTENGTDFVMRWGDLSGNGNDAVQATGSEQPKLNSSAVEYDGQDDWLEVSDGLASGDKAITILWLSRVEVSTRSCPIELAYDIDERQKSYRVLQRYKNNILRVEVNFGSGQITASPPNSHLVTSVHRTNTGGSGRLGIDGNTQDINIGSTLDVTGNVSSIGVKKSATTDWTLGEHYIGVVAGVDDLESQQKLEGWAAHKASRNGVDAPLQNLPASHPHKDDPPLA